MSNIPLEKSPYSLHFNKLKMLGAWRVKPRNAYIVNAYVVYKTFMTLVAALGSFSLFCDLYLVFGDFKKMTWNLCISTLFTASLIKNLVTVYNSNIIERMRVRLHRDASLRENPEDDIFYKLSLKELRSIQVMFYGLASIFVTLWLITCYISSFWNAKKMPIPLRLPFDIDIDNEFQYNFAFFMIGISSILGIILILETELAMFTILIQITQEYEILLKDISKLNELYASNVTSEGGKDGEHAREVNFLLKKSRTKSLVKEYSTRLQKMIEYTEDFELSYSPALLVQIFAMSVLVMVSALQCLLEYGDISMNLSYQMGYMFILVSDMFLVCWFATRIRTQCLRVGEKVYSTFWYRMSSDIQKDICMIIMRAQRPPRITFGKVMELNLHTFMLTLRNIYSWLALFQQLAL